MIYRYIIGGAPMQTVDSNGDIFEELLRCSQVTSHINFTLSDNPEECEQEKNDIRQYMRGIMAFPEKEFEKAVLKIKNKYEVKYGD
jgi:hypothetical protein